MGGRKIAVPELLAYHNDPTVKDRYLARVAQHRAADELIQGTAWLHGRGCAVGCTLEAYDHARYPIELGVPEVLAYLEDQLFELLGPADAQGWPERFLTAIPVGADLSRVWPRFAVWLLIDPEHGVLQHATRDAAITAIERVAALYARAASGEDVGPHEFAAEGAAAARAAGEAARAAGEAARDVARAAAGAVAWAAAGAARAAWARAACDQLVALLALAPTAQEYRRDEEEEESGDE